MRLSLAFSFKLFDLLEFSFHAAITLTPFINVTILTPYSRTMVSKDLPDSNSKNLGNFGRTKFAPFHNTYLKLKNITLFKLLIRTIFDEPYNTCVMG
jgi:hypothetical protein